MRAPALRDPRGAWRTAAAVGYAAAAVVGGASCFFRADLLTAHAALGSVLGGHLGDWAANRSPYHGRPLVAQASIALGMACDALVLYGLPRTADWFVPHAAAALLFGFCSNWVGPGVDRPIFATVVRPEMRATIQSYW